MDFKNKNRSIIIFLILVIIIFACFFSIKILNGIKKNLEIENALNINISNSNWPSGVPIIKSKYINITQLNENAWELSIKEKISYEEFKTYLIELFSEGFEPITELGSDNPKRLSTNEPTEDDFVLLWCGENDKYSIEAYWRNNNQYTSGEEVYIEDSVTILLFAKFDTITNVMDSSQNENFVSGDLNSGDVIQIEESSGDNTTDSGD